MQQFSLKDSVENFIFEEAELLDRWRLAEWENLLTDDAEYLVPPVGTADAETVQPNETMFVIADDRDMLHARVDRLGGRKAFCENPPSNMRHLIGNVRVLGEADGELRVAANFCVYRIRRAEITEYIGQYRYRLVRAGTSFKIRSKRVILDIDVLRGQGSISVIL